MSDNELDETFDNPIPVVDFKMPEPLTPDELKQVTDLMKIKSNKELSNLLTDISIKQNPNLNDMQKMQLQETLSKNIGNMSKRELINTLSQIINQSNKKLVFGDSSELNTMTTEQLSREQLLDKLRQKRTMQDKKKVQQMMQKLQDELINKPDDVGEEEVTSETPATNKKKNKKKKNKKANQKDLQEALVNKMKDFMKTNLTN
jgi:hypothetical protein